jgi:hypothetical protein
MVYSKIGHEKVVGMKRWRTHTRKRMGGSQRSEGHGYYYKSFSFTDSISYYLHTVRPETGATSFTLRVLLSPHRQETLVLIIDGISIFLYRFQYHDLLSLKYDALSRNYTPYSSFRNRLYLRTLPVSAV